MSDNKEERSIAQALGSVPKVYNQRAFNCTVTIAGTGLSDITTDDIVNALETQHLVVSSLNNVPDQMYVHEIRAYGTAGGYLSMAPYPHRQLSGPTYTDGISVCSLFNSYSDGSSESDPFNKGSLCQMYEFGINGATRPELVWKYPKTEIINNPFIVFNRGVQAEPSEFLQIRPSPATRICTIQSTNTGGNALYILQFDVTVRNSEFIPIASTLGGAAYGELNQMDDNYKPPRNKNKKTEDGLKAEETANKKRKVKSVKDLTLPALDSN